MSKIDTVIFDLGWVLVSFRPEEGMRNIGFSEEANRVFMEKIFSGLWESFDRTQENDEQIRAIFKEHVPGYEREVDMLWDNLPMITGVLPHTEKWLTDLKSRGYKLYVLSNFGKRSFEINSQLYTFLRHMDGSLISYEIMRTKPEPEIYNSLMEKYNIVADKAVFIDDRRENIEGAISCGLNGIWFQSYEQASRDLEDLLAE